MDKTCKWLAWYPPTLGGKAVCMRGAVSPEGVPQRSCPHSTSDQRADDCTQFEILEEKEREAKSE